jgi:ubiquinone/menaquinone biosynthesis C-methylase UbiE
VRGLEQIPWLYDLMFWCWERLGLLRWRRALGGGAAGRTLEVGCGTGRNLRLESSAPLLIGLDPDRDALRTARRRAPSVPLVLASGHDLPFRDGCFDTVVSALVFCSVPDPRRGLREVRRVLAPTGTLRMLEHVRSTSAVGARMQDAVQPLWTRVAGGCHPNRDTEAAVRQAGFAIDTTDRKARGLLRRFTARPS